MKTIKKLIFILGLTFILKVITSCIFPEAQVISFYPEELQIQLLDNSAYRVGEADHDTIPRGAVAFSLQITENMPMAAQYGKGIQLFTTATATSPPDPEYVIENPVKNIQVTTLFTLNGNTAAGADITSLFLFGSRQEFLYETRENAIENQYVDPYPEPVLNFDMYLQPSVANDSARFAIRVVLEDETVLADTTAVIHLY